MKRLPLLLALAACPPVDDDAQMPNDGCAWFDAAHATILAANDWVPTGPDALARPGDVLLANGHAAFVIQGPDDPRTYYHYGGIPIDAVPMDGCAQAGPEVFGEVGILPAKLELLDFTSSAMRQFRADDVEVLSDGSDGGDARVRFTGVDDRFWLVDHALTRQAAEGGGRRPLSGPLGVEVVVDYVLRPDEAVLRVEITTRNLLDVPNQVFQGALMFPSDLTPWQVYANDSFGFGGFNLQLGVPWFAMSNGETAYAFAMDTPNMAWTNVSGANALLDGAGILDSLTTLSPAGDPGDENTVRWYLATASGGANAATVALHAARPAFNGTAYALREVTGTVTGQGPTAAVEVWREDADGERRKLDEIAVLPDGTFSGAIPDEGRYSLRAISGHRPPSDVFALDDTGDLTNIPLAIGAHGTLAVQASDGDRDIPAKVSVYQDDRRVFRFYAPPEGGQWDIPPGAYRVAVTRGFEYAPFATDVRVPAGDTVDLAPTLGHVVDTTGWLSVDGHVHSAPSPDSDVLPERRFATVATAGLDVMVQTDHEIIADLSEDLENSPWKGHLATIVGEEVTATNPEHLNMWGVPLDDGDDPRGNPVVWYDKDIGQLYDAMRDRGAGIVQMNHPKWLTNIGWDVVTAEPTLTDATLYGFAPDQAVWSWDFDAIEIQNGQKSILGDGSDPGGSGLFRAWQSFINHGHRITGVGVSDVHGLDTPGEARTYVPAPDDIDSFVEGPVLAAVAEGNASTSTGAFVQIAVGNDDLGFDTTMGDTLTLTGEGDVGVQLYVQALPGIDVRAVYILANCDLVRVVDATDRDGIVKLDETVFLDLDADAHLTTVTLGDGAYPLGLDTTPDEVPRAITNPIFIDIDGNGRFDPPGDKACDLGDLGANQR